MSQPNIAAVIPVLVPEAVHPAKTRYELLVTAAVDEFILISFSLNPNRSRI